MATLDQLLALRAYGVSLNLFNDGTTYPYATEILQEKKADVVDLTQDEKIPEDLKCIRLPDFNYFFLTFQLFSNEEINDLGFEEVWATFTRRKVIFANQQLIIKEVSGPPDARAFAHHFHAICLMRLCKKDSEKKEWCSKRVLELYEQALKIENVSPKIKAILYHELSVAACKEEQFDCVDASLKEGLKIPEISPELKCFFLFLRGISESLKLISNKKLPATNLSEESSEYFVRAKASFDEAATMLDESLSKNLPWFPPFIPFNLGVAIQNYAQVLLKQGKFTASSQYLFNAIETYKRIEGIDAITESLKAEALYGCGACYEQLTHVNSDMDSGEKSQYLRKALEMYQTAKAVSKVSKDTLEKTNVAILRLTPITLV